MHTYLRTYMHIYIHMYEPTCIHTFVHRYKDIYKYISTYTNIFNPYISVHYRHTISSSPQSISHNSCLTIVPNAIHVYIPSH